MDNEIFDPKPLTEKQKRLAEDLALRSISDKKLTLEEIAEKHEIHPRTLYVWKRNPLFVAYMNQVSSLVLDSVTTEVAERLVSLVRSKNENVALKSIELFYKLSGKLQGNPTTNIVIETPQKATLIDDIQELEKRIARVRAGEAIDAEIIESD